MQWNYFLTLKIIVNLCRNYMPKVSRWNWLGTFLFIDLSKILGERDAFPSWKSGGRHPRVSCPLFTPHHPCPIPCMFWWHMTRCSYTSCQFDVGDWLHTEMFISPQSVTHPSTNRARRRLTSLIESNALLLSQLLRVTVWGPMIRITIEVNTCNTLLSL